MTVRLLPGIFVLAFLASCETTQPEKRHYLSSYHGMEKQTSGLGNTAMVREGDPKRLERYERVIIEDVRVIPSKSEDPRIQKVTRAESEKLAEKFEDILEQELGKHYEVTRYRSYKTLTVRAALTELKPSNPALFAVNYVPYASWAATGIKLATGETIGAGSTTVEIEVLDSRSRRQLFAMVDQLKGSKYNPAGIDRWGQTETAMRSWARRVRLGVQGKKPPLMSPAPEKKEKKSS